jgi:hypothetical protein
MVLARMCLVLFSALMCSGCTHVQLQKNTVHEAWTLGEIQQQQVVNNLALFVYNYNALPSFAIPNQGSSQVTDQGNAGFSMGFSRPITGGSTANFTPAHFGDFLLSALGFSGTAQRSCQEAFTLTPINDPRKLELMRCAYQQAVSNCGYGDVSQHCPDCQTRMKQFYTGDPDGDIAARANGIVTSECLKPNCWFHVGCKKDVPKDCCKFVGEYCGVYVWVGPEGRNELAKLTLAILDYALHDPPTLRTKQVVFYLDEYGLPTLQSQAVGTVSAAINIDENNVSLLSTASSTADAARLEQVVSARLLVINQRIEQLAASKLSDKASSDERLRLVTERDSLEHKLQFLNEQFRTGTLKEKFYPPATSGTGVGAPLMQFNLQQNALTPPTPGLLQ